MAKRKSFWDEVQSDLKKFFSDTKKQTSKGIKKQIKERKQKIALEVIIADRKKEEKCQDKGDFSASCYETIKLTTTDKSKAQEKAIDLRKTYSNRAQYKVYIAEKDGSLLRSY